MDIETIIRLHNDLIKLDPTQPSIVQYDPSQGLIYRQLGKVVAIPYVSYLYFPTPKLTLGILTQSGYHELVQALEKLLEEPDLKKNRLSQVLKSYGVEIYKTYDNQLVHGPQLLMELNFVTIRRSWISKLILKYYSPETKVLLKAINNETNKSRSNK